MKLLTVSEVAEGMRISVSTVRRLIRRGLITAYRVGDRGQLRIKQDDIDKYIESHRVETDDPASSRSARLESDE